MRSSFARLASPVALFALLLVAGCGGIERGHNTANTDAGSSKDMAGTGSCANCSGKCCLNKCTDTNTDVHNCGACGMPCAAGFTCIGGICQCAGAGGQGAVKCQKDEACCSGKCVAIMSDATNCGSCGKDCTAASETCHMGQCGCGSAGSHCKPEETCCGASCPNLQIEVTDCGACGNKCNPGETCEAGVCTGGGGGGCNPPCMAPLVCQNGMCGIGGVPGICMSDKDCMPGQHCIFPIPGLPVGVCM